MVKHWLLTAQQKFLATANLRALNIHAFKLALRSLGLLNSDSEFATGEPHWLNHLKQHHQIQTIVDVGANDQAYGATLFPTAQIYAFEPHPMSFGRLKKHAPSHVTCIHAAVGDHSGTTFLWDFADHAPKKSLQPTSQLASLHKEVITKLHGQSAKKYTVPLMSLDDAAIRHRITHIDLLKIDAEGHELAVLMGAQRLLAKRQIDIIQFEFNEMMAYSHTHFLDFVTLLPDFEFFRLLPTSLLPLGPYRPLTHELYGFQNIIAIHTALVTKIIG